MKGQDGREVRPPHHGGPVRALSLEQRLELACRRQLQREVIKGHTETSEVVEFGTPPDPIRMPDGSLRHRPAPELAVRVEKHRSLPAGFVAAWVQRVRQRAENVIAVIWDDPNARLARPYSITVHMLPPRGRRSGMRKFRGRQGLARAGSKTATSHDAAARASAPLLHPKPVSRLFDLLQEVVGLDLRQPESSKECRAWEMLVLQRLRALQPHLAQLDQRFTFLTVSPSMTREEAFRWWPEIERRRGRPGVLARGIHPYRRLQAKLWSDKANEGKTFPQIERWYRETFPEARFCHACDTTVFVKEKEANTCPCCRGPTWVHPRPNEKSTTHPSAGAIREAVSRYKRMKA